MATIERIHLTILREAQQRGSLTAASRHLGLTQSALSHTMKKLEQDSGAKLWTKEGRGLKLTDAGKYLLTVASRLLPQMEQADDVLREYAGGGRGSLRIGMECHPCYQWLLSQVSPYLKAFPHVDLDVRQKFQFGGVGALFGHEIDLLVTPDPLPSKGLVFEPVFDYEHVLVVARDHPLAKKRYVEAAELTQQTLLTYPVELERLDIFSHFLLPAGLRPRKHQTLETTDIMLKLVECGRGVAALPKWLVKEQAKRLELKALRLGKNGLHKSIHLGYRRDDAGIDYLRAFVSLAKKKPNARPARVSATARR